MTDKLNLCFDMSYFEKEIESKKPLVLNTSDTIDYVHKIIRYNPAYLLFLMQMIPERRYFNNTNYAIKSQEASNKKRELDYLEAVITLQICGMPEYKNAEARTSAVIIEKYKSEDYNKKLKEYNDAVNDRDAYKNLAEYHKDLSFLIQTELKVNGVIDTAEKELIGDTQ